MTMIVAAKQLSAPPNAKAGEGVWRVWVDDPPRAIELSLIPNGEHADDRWIYAGYDPVLGRRIGGSDRSPAHALFDAADQVMRWRRGEMPRMAVTGDPRIVVPAPEVVAGVDQDARLSDASYVGLPSAKRDPGSTPGAPTKPAARRAAAKRKNPPKET